MVGRMSITVTKASEREPGVTRWGLRTMSGTTMPPRPHAPEPAQVPLAGHDRVVAGVLQQFGEGCDALVEVALIAGRRQLFSGGIDSDHAAETGLMGIGPAEQHGARRRAGRIGVEVGEHQSRGSQSVDVRCQDLAAIGAHIGESQVVGGDEEYVRAPVDGRRGD